MTPTSREGRVHNNGVAQRRFLPRLLASVFFFLCFAVATGGAHAAGYPRYVGYVNDFSNVMSPAERRQLEGEIRSYEKQTSIEIAVVTVPTLDGQSVEDYTIGLAQSWGVGKKGKDNGVVLLVATGERKIRIETGYGLEQDLPDLQAGRIIREQIAPLLKQQKMGAGLSAGVLGIMAVLGDKPFQARVEERQAAAEKAKLEAERGAAAFRSNLMIGGGILFFIIVVGGAIWMFVVAERRRKALHVFHERNATTLEKCQAYLAEAAEERPKAQAVLDRLKRENPPAVWSELEKMLFQGFADLDHSQELYRAAKAAHYAGWKNAESSTPAITLLAKRASAWANMYEDAVAIENRVASAKRDVPKLLASLPEGIENARDIMSHSDVSAGARAALDTVRKKLSEVEALLQGSQVNWLVALSAVGAVGLLLTKTVQDAEKEKQYASTARTEGPKLLKSLPALISEATQAVHQSDVSSSTKALVADAEHKYDAGRALTPDWVKAYGLLSEAKDLALRAKKKASEDRQEAENRRRKKREDAERAQAALLASSSSYSSSSSSSDGGGFGGGGFGGGGASGSY